MMPARSLLPRALAAPALLALACAAPARPPAPAQAASAVPLARLALAGAGPFYTLRVPIALQSAAASADLSDLRVRNAAGETMAFAWATSAAGEPPPQPRTSAALYKVAPPPAAPGSGTTAGTAAPQPAWIVDTRDDHGVLARLDLSLAPGAQGIWALSIEASDDLRHWRVVEPHAALVRLQQLPVVGGGEGEVALGGAQPLESTTIDLDGVAARYLRLSVAPGAAPPPLEKAAVTRMRRDAMPAPLDWSAAIAPASCELGHCDYALPRHLAPEALQVVLADPDTVGQVTVLGRDDAPAAPYRHRHLLRGALHGTLHALHAKTARQAPGADAAAWDFLAAADVYWLRQSSDTRELRSPPIRLDGRAWPMLRLQVAGEIGQLGHAPPLLRLGVRPRTLVFLARGAAPFELASTPAVDAAPPLALAQLMPGRAVGDPLPADSAVPETAVASTPAAQPPASAPAARPTATTPPRSPWLWAALLAGLALMAGFAWTLLRRPRVVQEIDPTSLR